jgi:hypothetical protein
MEGVAYPSPRNHGAMRRQARNDAALGAGTGPIGGVVQAATAWTDSPSGTQHYRHGQIGHEQRCVDDEDPEHRSPQHRPIGNPDAPAAHEDRQIIGELAEVTRGEKQEQRDLRFNRLEEGRSRRQQIERQQAIGRLIAPRKATLADKVGAIGLPRSSRGTRIFSVLPWAMLNWMKAPPNQSVLRSRIMSENRMAIFRRTLRYAPRGRHGRNP